MLAGTWAAALLLARFTTNPPVGARSLILTVPGDELPLVTVAGDTLTELGTGARTVRSANAEAPFADAVILAVWLVWVWLVVTLNAAWVSPAAMVTDAEETWAAPLLLD